MFHVKNKLFTFAKRSLLPLQKRITFRNEKNTLIKFHKNGKKPVLEILKSIILACNIFGIQTFVINNNTIKAPKFNIFKTSYAFFITSIIVYSAIYVVLYNKTSLQYYKDLAVYFSNIFIFIIGNLCFCICRSKFTKSIEQIIQVEETLSNLGLVQPYKKHQVLIILQLIILFIICILRLLTDIQLHFKDTNITIFKFICDIISLITHILILALFSNIILIMNSKFKILNSILKCYIKKTKYNASRACLVNVIPPLSKPYPHIPFKLYILQKIKMLHYELCDITKQLNYIFNIPLLLSSGILFVSFTSDIYLLYRETFFYDRIYYILSLTISSIKLSLIVLPCSIIKNESTRTLELLQDLAVLNDHKVQDEIENLFLQIMHQQVKLTACGYFTLDNTFFLMIISAATSYIIIIIQFDS